MRRGWEILNRRTRESFTDISVKPRTQGREELSFRRKSKHKGPEAGPYLICSRTSRETSVPGVRKVRKSRVR